jgi:hypothetical protein
MSVRSSSRQSPSHRSPICFAGSQRPLSSPKPSSATRKSRSRNFAQLARQASRSSTSARSSAKSSQRCGSRLPRHTTSVLEDVSDLRLTARDGGERTPPALRQRSIQRRSPPREHVSPCAQGRHSGSELSVLWTSAVTRRVLGFRAKQEGHAGRGDPCRLGKAGRCWLSANRRSRARTSESGLCSQGSGWTTPLRSRVGRYLWCRQPSGARPGIWVETTVLWR